MVSRIVISQLAMVRILTNSAARFPKRLLEAAMVSENEVPSDARRIEGFGRLLRAEGTRLNQRRRLWFEDGRVILFGGRQFEWSTYRFDAKGPTWIDVGDANGIWAMDGEELRLCLASAGRPRPAAF